MYRHTAVQHILQTPDLLKKIKILRLGTGATRRHPGSALCGRRLLLFGARALCRRRPAASPLLAPAYRGRADLVGWVPGRVAPRPRPLLLCAALRWGDDGDGRGAEGVANKDGGTGGVSERPRAERVGVGPGMRVSFIYVIRWQIRGSVGDPRWKIKIRPKPDTVWVSLKPKPLDLKPADIHLNLTRCHPLACLFGWTYSLLVHKKISLTDLILENNIIYWLKKYDLEVK